MKITKTKKILFSLLLSFLLVAFSFTTSSKAYAAGGPQNCAQRGAYDICIPNTGIIFKDDSQSKLNIKDILFLSSLFTIGIVLIVNGNIIRNKFKSR